jgi:hypothetical protein
VLVILSSLTKYRFLFQLLNTGGQLASRAAPPAPPMQQQMQPNNRQAQQQQYQQYPVYQQPHQVINVSVSFYKSVGNYNFFISFKHQTPNDGYDLYDEYNHSGNSSNHYGGSDCGYEIHQILQHEDMERRLSLQQQQQQQQQQLGMLHQVSSSPNMSQSPATINSPGTNGNCLGFFLILHNLIHNSMCGQIIFRKQPTFTRASQDYLGTSTASCYDSRAPCSSSPSCRTTSAPCTPNECTCSTTTSSTHGRICDWRGTTTATPSIA